MEGKVGGTNPFLAEYRVGPAVLPIEKCERKEFYVVESVGSRLPTWVNLGSLGPGRGFDVTVEGDDCRDDIRLSVFRRTIMELISIFL